MFDVVTEHRNAYVTARQKAKALLANGKKRQEAEAAFTHQVIPALNSYRETWQKFIDLQNDAMQQSIKQSHEAYATGRRIAILLMFVMLGFAVLASVTVTRSITIPIQQVVELAQHIAEARQSATPGEIFTPAVAAAFRSMISSTMQGTRAKRIRRSLAGAEPVRMELRVNEPYPNSVPLQSTPPSLLLNLPKYRYVENKENLLTLDDPELFGDEP